MLFSCENDSNAFYRFFVGENDIINGRPDLFTLTPPFLNHSLSFVASKVAMLLDDFGGFNEEVRGSRLFRTFYGCGLFRQLSSQFISLTIQPGKRQTHEKMFHQ